MFWRKLKRDWLVQSIVLLTQCICSFILSLQDSARLGKGWNIYFLLALWTMLIQLYLSCFHLPHLLEKCRDGGGSWPWILAHCERPGSLSSCLVHRCKPGDGSQSSPRALDNPDVISYRSEGVGGQAEFGMSSGKMCRSGVQFLQVSPGVWGTARAPQGIKNAVRYLWLLSKGVHKDLLSGAWPSVSFFN